MFFKLAIWIIHSISQFILHEYFPELKHFDFVLTCAQQVFEAAIYITTLREALYNLDQKNFDQLDKIYCRYFAENLVISRVSNTKVLEYSSYYAVQRLLL